MQLVIAEKPSVAASIAKVLGADRKRTGYLEGPMNKGASPENDWKGDGSNYLVSWCLGHLIELEQPDVYDERYQKWRIEDLPIVPETWKYRVSEGTKRQFFILKELMTRKDVTEIIEATDAGREGELIFRLVYEMAGCTKPFRRLWISSLEDQAIRKGFAELRDGSEFDPLYAAAKARSRADWLVGINGSRLFTKLYDKKLAVGRVQTPTLSMLTKRQREINDFRKQKYFNVHLSLNGVDVVKEKIFDQEEAERLVNACRGQQAVVVNAEDIIKSVSPPKLYDLTTLQRDSNRYFGYTAQQTLNFAQSLYEKKLVTYPRTDSCYLTDDMAGTAYDMAEMAESVFRYSTDLKKRPEAERLFDSKKVNDHHAILPTAEIEKQSLKGLEKGEQDILQLISIRLLEATAKRHVFCETVILAECAGEEFRAKGKRIVEPGWKAIEDEFRSRIHKESQDALKKIPLFTKGKVFEGMYPMMTEHFTEPPKVFTEDVLLQRMETAGNESFEEDTEKKGIGTPATRAAIIEKLVRNGYARRKGRQLIPTEDGMALVSVLPEELCSPKLTSDWENDLLQMERGQLSEEKFMAGITGMVTEMVKKYGSLPDTGEDPFSGTRPRPQRKTIGRCPRCGSSVYEGEKNYYCSNRQCSFCIWKESKWLASMQQRITADKAAGLLGQGRLKNLRFYSKRAGRYFNADLVLRDDGDRVNFALEFQRH